MMGLVVVGSGLPGYPSPGSNRPATYIARPASFQSALATMTPGLHFGFYDVAGVSGRTVAVNRSNGLCLHDLAGHFPVSVSYGIN
jgi:hypothetical protein